MIRRTLRVLALACATVALCFPAVYGAQADVTAPAGKAKLKISPDEGFVGGQALRWSGNLGVSGKRTIKMQKHLGREVDEWEDVRDFTGETDAAGDFAYWYPAPAMQEIEYRVASESDDYTTPSVVPGAVQPDLILWVTGGDRDNPRDVGRAAAGVPFGISVDTTPELFRRPDTVGLQPYPGRELTLQRRVEGTGDAWTTLATTTVGEDGMGYFTGVTESTVGEVVYRVREENWFQGKNKIGWFPSFPTYVTIWKAAAEASPSMASPIAAPVRNATVPPATDPDQIDPDAAGGTASQEYDWPAPYFDFAWSQGESLTSPPSGGTRRKGWWLDYSDGGGRLSKDGGGLMLDSKRNNDTGRGDFGTTSGTLQKNWIDFGRWETKLAATSEENNAADYRLRLELVPNKKQDDACRTITIADFTNHGTTMDFGVNAVDSQWTGSYELGDVDHTAFAFAIEVAQDHITWFVNAEPVGTVTDKDAITGVPLTLRISMVSDGDREMNRTELKSDWQRGFSIEGGDKVPIGPPLIEGVLDDC